MAGDRVEFRVTDPCKADSLWAMINRLHIIVADGGVTWVLVSAKDAEKIREELKKQPIPSVVEGQ